ncbi:MAG: hypothetical protein COX70_05415 [Flavobacteriales bacterium CG_4_10_14_0_2_um_filter_32_8]|nr:MAG: hypothetical protein COX70_05415 [Flavobacteriales bacterium CG_4_10_14_0_2_um_filter_32_8]PJB14458.1 MAG: hypothetical protein CO118_08440 [Flavobacteriales bacterium CG_4_9_14_3_um_filter_32_8]
MKKKVLFVASLFVATAIFAQDGLTSKKGEAYLPEAGDWSIGFNASALTYYAGNLFNGNVSNTALTSGSWMNGSVDQEIRFKMFKDEKTAYRLRARIGMSSSGGDLLGKYDQDANDSTEIQDYVVNTKNSNGFTVILGAGIEKRRGNTRIQGYYGGEIFFGLLGGTDTKTDDGRILSDDWFQPVGADPYDYAGTFSGNVRTTEVKTGSGFTLGLQGFIGVEWFFAPKVSLGAEYTWGLGMSSVGEGETTTEYWGLTDVEIATFSTAPNHVVTETNKTGKTGTFSFDTGHNAMLNLNFHF